jgi:hypothetical protein
MTQQQYSSCAARRCTLCWPPTAPAALASAPAGPAEQQQDALSRLPEAAAAAAVAVGRPAAFIAGAAGAAAVSGLGSAVSGGLGPGQGLTVESLEVPAAAGVRREYAGAGLMGCTTVCVSDPAVAAQPLLRLPCSVHAAKLIIHPTGKLKGNC